MLALGAWLVLRGEITGGAMIAASILLGRALSPVETAISQWSVIQRGVTSWRALAALLTSTPAPPTPTLLPRPDARLEVTGLGVRFRAGDQPVLQNVGFTVMPGTALGIIGRSGSGKSTLARVVTGLVQPQAGEVRLAGATLTQYGPDELGKYVGYLPQDVRFFDGTIAQNIAHMEPEPDPEKVVDAARKAQVHDIVLRLPDGYDTRITECDSQLSGGQKQRLALARALYKDPVLLVLDEPNSALDADGSEALNAVVAAMKSEGRAVLIMTHRPTAISSCDMLLVLDGGRVAALGPRDEVIRSMLKNAGDVQRVVGGSAS
jgi:ABC-type protease/lipase transport system fused ATPase/permease subunit